MHRPKVPLTLFCLFPTFLILTIVSCFHKTPAPVNEAAAPPAAQSSAPPAPLKDTIAIAFYNVENLFDLLYDGSEYPEYRPGALGWDKQRWEKKAGNIASVIAAMKADIVGLCEVENDNALMGLQEELVKRGAAYPYRAIADAPFQTNTAPCLLSAFPIVAVKRLGGGADGPRAKRNILEADVDPGGGTIKLFVTHWPSKAHPESQRLAVARAMRGRIDELPRGTEYAVLGDLNEDYDEFRRFHTEGHDDTRGTTGLNHVLKTVRSTGRTSEYVGETFIAAADSGCHFDLWLDLPESRRASCSYRGQNGTLDHILLPHALFDGKGWSYAAGSFSAFAWDGRLLKDGVPFRWQMKGRGKRRFHVGEGYSDHLPVRALLVHGPFVLSANGRGQAEAASSKDDGGFETSTGPWVGCTPGISVSRDTSAAARGRCCLKIRGGAPAKNGCAARALLRMAAANRGRSVTVSFDIKGAGALSLRIRAGDGKWRYYNGGTFLMSGAPRYLPAQIPSWRHASLSFASDRPSSTDLELEFRAGKGAPFCFYLDNVEVR